FGAEGVEVAEPPFGGGLRLGQRLGAAFCTAVAAVDVEVGRELAQYLGAVLLDLLADVGARDREAFVDVPPPGAGRPVQRGPAEFLEVGARFLRGGVALARAGAGIALDEAEAAVAGEEHRRA